MLLFIICIISVISAHSFYFVWRHKAIRPWTRTFIVFHLMRGWVYARTIFFSELMRIHHIWILRLLLKLNGVWGCFWGCSYINYWDSVYCIYCFILFCRNKKSKGGISKDALDTASDDDDNGNDNSRSPTVTEKTRAVNAKGLEVLGNGVVSMRALDLAHQVPTKSRDADAPKLFSVSLTLSKAFTLICSVHCCKHMPVEKHRDEPARLIIL